MESDFNWLKRHALELAKKDKVAFAKLGKKMKEIGLIFKEANLNTGTKGTDCDTEAGNGGSCDNYSCIFGGGGDCDDNSCANVSDGGNCGNSICDSCATSGQ